MFPQIITTEYIVSQAIGAVTLILVCISYFCRKDKLLFIMGSANLIEAVGYFLLNSYVGAIGTILATIRCGIFCFCEKKYKKIPISVFCITMLFFTASTLIFWHSVFDLIELGVLIFFTIGFLFKDEWKVRFFALIGTILGIVYNVLIFNYIGVLCRIIELIVILIALIKFLKKKKKSW